MSEFEFTCDTCGELHRGAPSFGFAEPLAYASQSEAVKKEAKFNSDLCVYEDEDGRHHFVRACLEIPIHGFDEPFLWGVWYSVSADNFARYVETFEDADESDSYFGWFGNLLPYYPKTLGLKVQVRPRVGGARPFLDLHEADHPLFVDLQRGLSVSRAKEIAESVMHQTDQRH